MCARFAVTRWLKVSFGSVRVFDDTSASHATLQNVLETAWTKSAVGYLAPWAEAKAGALREIWRSEYESDHGLLIYVAGKVVKTGGGNPSPAAIS